MAILNLTQHNSTKDQINAGIIDLPAEFKTALVGAITFPAIYTKADLERKARCVLEVVRDYTGPQGGIGSIEGVMIGGMPSFMPVLERVLSDYGIKVGYACTDRVSEDVQQSDGSVKKVAVFKHVGMYWAS